VKNKRILFVGCGELAINAGQKLISQGADVVGLRRRPGLLPEGFTELLGDVTQPESLAVLDNQHFDFVVVTLTPGEISEAAYQRVYVDGSAALLARLADKPIQRVLFVSSTSVYGQNQSEWVDETSPTEAKSFSGQRMRAAEALYETSPLPCSAVRFSGIYGPGRYRLIQQVAQYQGCAAEPAMFSNRIHRDDCVGVLVHLLNRAADGEGLERCYLASDSSPVTLHEVKRWIAGQLDIPVADLDESQASTRAGSKRCSNKRLLASGYRFQYPSFSDGYAAIVAAYRQEQKTSA